MAQTVKNVTAAKPKKTGAAYRAPSGTTVPTSATDALSADYIPLGYISEDGITNSNSRTTTDIKAWGGDVVLSTQDEKSDKFKFTLIEALNPEVLKAVHGDDNVTGSLTDGITVSVGSDEPEHGVWIFDMLMRDDVVKRIVVPDAKVTGLDDITYKDGLVGYGVTLTAYPDGTDENKTHYEYIKSAS